MNLLLHPLPISRLDQLTAGDEQFLLDNARALLDTTPAQARSLLRGKNLGVLCEHRETAALFVDAAEGLGARVAHIRPCLSQKSDPLVVRDTARMLARLYDGIECRDVPAELVRRIGAEADVPVYDGLSSPDHPTAALCGMLRGRAGNSAWMSIVQAVLLSTLL